MFVSLKLSIFLFLLTLGPCSGRRTKFVNKEEENEEPLLVAGTSPFGSLWPLPQKVSITDVSFKLTGSSFNIVDATKSSAGPSCNVLQNAYRR